MHTSGIDARIGESYKLRYLEFEQHVACILLVNVSREVQAVVEEVGIQTYIPRLCCLPSDVVHGINELCCCSHRVNCGTILHQSRAEHHIRLIGIVCVVAVCIEYALVAKLTP